MAATKLFIDLDALTPEKRRFLINTLALYPPALPEFSENPLPSVAESFINAAAKDVPVDDEEPTEDVEVPATVELDKNGMPWDERIHSSKKSLTAEGIWRLRKGVDKVLVEKVEAQLKAVNVASAPAAVIPMPTPATVATPAVEVPTTTAPVAVMPTPATVAAPVVEHAVTAQAPSVDAVGADKPGLIKTLQLSTKLQQAGILTGEQVDKICAEVSSGAVTSSAMLARDIAFVPGVYTVLKAYEA